MEIHGIISGSSNQEGGGESNMDEIKVSHNHHLETVGSDTKPKADSMDSSSSTKSYSSDEEESGTCQKIKRSPRPRPLYRSQARKMSTPGGPNNYSMTCLERLIRTHPIWFLPKVNRDDAVELLAGKESGAFIVRQSSQNNTLALSVKLVDEEQIEHYLIQQSESSPSKLNLESSEHSFDNVLSLVYHYSTSKDELPTALTLPSSLRDSNSRQNLSSVALLGKDYWKYPMSQNGSIEKQKVPPSTPNIKSPMNARRKLSEPVNHANHEAATATLEETLNGLQKVSDMLQASLKDLETEPPVPPPRISSSPLIQRKNEMNSTEMLRSNQPIVQLRSKLSEEMFGTVESVGSSTKHWYSYYRSSIADKISDYEDIWEKTAEPSRCLSPAESELQFKAYLANKLANQDAGKDLPSSQCSSSSDEAEPRSTTSSTGLSSLNGSSDSLSSFISEESLEDFDETEIIYSDPLDALEKAEDTRIYNCPEFDQELEAERIYEEAGKKLELVQNQQHHKADLKQSSPKRRKRATISSAEAPVIKVEEKLLQRRSHSYVVQQQFSAQKITKTSPTLSSSAGRAGATSPIAENKRLSAVVSKYFKPIAKQTWQMDSSSWEFLNQQDPSDNAAEHKQEDKSKQVDSGLDSTLSYTNKSDDKDSLYESELGTLNTESMQAGHGEAASSSPTADAKSQLFKSRQRIKDYVIHQLTNEKWLFGKMIAQFLDCTGKVGAQQIFTTLRNVRQFMSGMKNYLIRHGEADLHSIINEERSKLNSDEFLNVDLLLEESMHILVIGPLTTCLRESLRLQSSTFSSSSELPPTSSEEVHDEFLKLSPTTKNAFKDCFIQMRNSVSPLDKLAHLLTGLKVLTNAVGEKEMSDLNAENFCWLLAHILKELQMNDWIEVDLELLWNLLPQSVLKGLSNGEATYYLTLVSSAANINRQNSGSLRTQQTSPLKQEANNTASLKSSSSTTSGQATSVMLTVTIPQSESSSLVTKNVPLRNDTAKVKEICTVLGHMCSISNPSEFTLFSIVDGQESLLQDDDKPLLIVDQARLQGKNYCAFAYQRKDAQNAWPSQMGIDLSKP